jgi:hypothetical protein
MAAPLNTYTTIEQRGDVRFLWAKNMAAKDIHKEKLFQGLVKRWDKCLNLYGDYVEK